MTTKRDDSIRDDAASARTRRDFLRATTLAAVSASVATTLVDQAAPVVRAARLHSAHIAGSDAIRVGVIGCGGRGTGAARNALDAAPDVRIVAVADAFRDRVDSSLAELKKQFADRIDVPAERQFGGLNAYKDLLATDINYVILATPPGFRPAHLRAAVNAGKHIFTEKPVAVDATGIRECFAAYEDALKKNLGIVAGTQRRHQQGYVETIKRIHDGAIGEIVAANVKWNQGGLWDKPRTPGMSDVEWQMRNWIYFTWLSGDQIVEQHVHNIDVANWAMRAHPVKAISLGGRQVRTDPKHGHIFDHFATDYEYENGATMFSMCRQQENTASNVSEMIVGTKGRARVERYSITGENPWRLRLRRSDDWMLSDAEKRGSASAQKEVDPYLQEHIDLITSIRANRPLNELKIVTESTLTAIMGRMSAYTGQEVTWEQALNSKENLMPADLAFGERSVPLVPMPGITKLV